MSNYFKSGMSASPSIEPGKTCVEVIYLDAEVQFFPFMTVERAIEHEGRMRKRSDVASVRRIDPHDRSGRPN